MAVAMMELEAEEQLETQTRSARQIALQAVLLGILADNVFRSALEGFGWTIWIAALVIATILVLRYRSQSLRTEQTIWLLVAVGCAFGVARRAAEPLLQLNVLGTLVALAMFSMVSVGRPATSIFTSRLRDAFAAWIYAAKDGLLGAFGLVRDADMATAVRSSATARKPALRAAVLTLPLFLVFTALLSRADPVFGSIFRLPDIELEEIVSHVMLGGIFAWLSAGWMRGALLSTTGRSAWASQLPVKLGMTEVTSSLGAVLGLFAMFVAIQLRWLFGGADVVQATTGLSVAEYARRGFFELVTVGALVLPLILGTRALIDDDAVIRRHARLSVALLVLLGAIMTSAALRMQLYVHHFGLTTDRLYALVFMMWLAIVFVGLGLTVLRGWQRPFAGITAVSGFATLFALTVANPERIVANVNLNRTAAALPVDYEYLARLSGDAAPLVAQSLVQAEASPGACNAAKRLRQRGLQSAGVSQAHVGARGYAAALRTITSQDLQRLCAE
jgi:hypothetical protein